MKTENLTFYRLPIHSEPWFRFRETGLTEEDCKEYNCPPYAGGLGASESATILGLSKYRPVAPELFLFKSGIEKQHKEDNRSMLMGRILEPLIKEIWSCFDGDEYSWVENYKTWKESPPGQRRKHQIRHAKFVNNYIVNSRFPWLFASLDCWAEKDSFSLLTGEKMEDGFNLELKTIGSFTANQWLSEIPAAHISQINQQMLITETDYCELAVLVDGRVFKCIPFEKDEKLCNQILEISYEFWQRVLKGREAFQAKNKAIEVKNIAEAEKQQGVIDFLEPMPDDNASYEEYMKERYTKEIDTITGTTDDFNLCKLHQAYLEVEKLSTTKKQLFKNRLIHRLNSEKAGKIDFDVLGYVSYLKEGKKTSPTLRINIKDKISKDKIEEEFNKIKFE